MAVCNDRSKASAARLSAWTRSFSALDAAVATAAASARARASTASSTAFSRFTSLSWAASSLPGVVRTKHLPCRVTQQAPASISSASVSALAAPLDLTVSFRAALPAAEEAVGFGSGATLLAAG